MKPMIHPNQAQFNLPSLKVSKESLQALSEESIETDEEIKGSLLIISQKKQRQR
jgi:hypothetical protein